MNDDKKTNDLAIRLGIDPDGDFHPRLGDDPDKAFHNNGNPAWMKPFTLSEWMTEAGPDHVEGYIGKGPITGDVHIDFGQRRWQLDIYDAKRLAAVLAAVVDGPKANEFCVWAPCRALAPDDFLDCSNPRMSYCLTSSYWANVSVCQR
jgi:hypothetical protein